LINDNKQGWAARSIIVASITLAFGLVDMRQSFAGCGGYCEARQARAICHSAVNAQGLKAQAREAEFEKCRADPASYLQLEQVTDDAEMTLE
jgi:DNA-directed RNA polymerase subunit M/transcription elongation factor TFIIS